MTPAERRHARRLADRRANALIRAAQHNTERGNLSQEGVRLYYEHLIGHLRTEVARMDAEVPR